MAGQSVERREMLRILAIAAAASSFPGFQRWAFACGHGDPKPPSAPAADYTPQFFTAHEYATVERLTDLIIPADGGPGAKEAGVSEFIDFIVWSDPSIQYRFRYGLTWLDTRSGELHHKPFLELDEAGQKDMLDHLAYKQKFRPREQEGRDFFALIRDHTMMGFYTSRVGLQELDYPGLKVLYTQTPTCPHHGDPGHLQLPPAKY